MILSRYFYRCHLIVFTEAVILFIELPIKYIESFDIRLPVFKGFSAYFRRLTFKLFRFFLAGGGGGGMPPVPQVAHAYAFTLKSAPRALRSRDFQLYRLLRNLGFQQHWVLSNSRTFSYFAVGIQAFVSSICIKYANKLLGSTANAIPPIRAREKKNYPLIWCILNLIHNGPNI